MVRACWLVPLSHGRWLTRAVASLGSRVWCADIQGFGGPAVCVRGMVIPISISLARFQRELTLCIGVCVQWLRPKSFLSQVCTHRPKR